MSPRSALVLIAVLAAALPASGRKLLLADGPQPVAVEVSGDVYTYYPLEPGATITVAVEGPVLFDAISRLRFRADEGSARVEVEVALDGVPVRRELFTARPGSATYPDIPGALASPPHRISLEVPSGSHDVSLKMLSGRGPLDINPLSRALPVLPWRLDWRLEAGVSYDSNIFRYGDPDVEGFQDGERPERYGMDSVDDGRLEPSVQLDLTREEPGRRSTRLRLSADWRLALSNGEKSFSKLGAALREERRGVAFLEMEYAAIPRYHIRLLWDPDLDGGAYRSCDFRKHAVSLEMGSLRSLPVDVSGLFKVETYAYDPDFMEYDSVARTVGATATVRPARGLRVDAGYSLRSALARGSDEEGEARATSDDSDTTYDQDEYSLRVRWEAGRWFGRRTVLYGTIRHARRYYLTSKSGDLDPYHAGREDRYWISGARLRLGVSRDAGVEVFYQMRRRAVDSPFVDDIDDLKDYTAHRVGVMYYVERGRFLD